MVTVTDVLNLDLCGKFITDKVRNEIKQLVDKSDIGEKFNYDAEYKYLGYNQDDELVIIVAYMIQLDENEVPHPRFIHVILDESVRRTKEALKFIKFTFNDIASIGYRDCVAIISKSKKNMIEFAERFGFVPFFEDDNYKYYVKDLNQGG